MLDLFGDPIDLPVKRGKASAALGAQRPPRQPPLIPPQRPATPEVQALDDEVAELVEILNDALLRDVVAQYMEDQNLPFVDVAKVQEGLFARSRLEAFDFVVQATEGHNWLLYAAPLSVAAQDDLREWERIFGPGFTALVADKVEEDDDTFTLAFRTLEGEKVDLAGRPTRHKGR